MYKKNDYVINKNQGLCQIADICLLEGMNYKCYLLSPVNNPTLKIYIPVKSASIHLRRPVAAEQALESIKKLQYRDIENIKNFKTKISEYKKLLNEGTTENLSMLVKFLYDREKELVKEPSYINILKTAETLYLTELGFSLGKTNESVRELIFAEIKNSDKE